MDLNFLGWQDLNYVEQALGGPYLPVAMLPEKDKLLLAKMESRLPLDIFEEVLRAATDACQQVMERICTNTRRGRRFGFCEGSPTLRSSHKNNTFANGCIGYDNDDRGGVLG